MTRKTSCLAFHLLFALACSAAFAQATKSLGKIKEVHVTGLKRYTTANILAATGLAVGQTVFEGDLQNAASRLGSTGAFSDIVFNYSTLSGTVKVEFTVVEADKLLALRFENFVWWTDDELREQLRQRVLLFKDELPVSGALADSVADALQAMVSERDVPGHVQYSRYAKEGGPIEAYLYHIDEAGIRIRSVDFPGGAPEEVPELQSATRKQLLGKDYLASQVVIVAAHDFRDVYLRHGYLQADFGAPAAKVSAAAASDTADAAKDEPTPVFVTVTVPVQPGPQFLLGGVDFAGNHAFPNPELEKFVTVLTGQPANLPQLQRGLEEMRKLYGTRGYMRIEQKLDQHLDTATKTARFTVQIAEGAVYKFGELTIEGIDSQIAAKLRDQWSLRPDEPFDTSYEERFLKETQKLLPPGRWSISVQEHVNESDKTVDLTLRYVPPIPN